MAEGIPARLSAAAGRKFGLTLGIAFLVFGGLFMWRQKPVRADIALAIGTVLLAAAFVAPTALGPVERAWMGLAHLISKVTTPIFMGVVYYLVITPIGVLRRSLGGAPLRRRDGQTSHWFAHKAPADAREAMERQF